MQGSAAGMRPFVVTEAGRPGLTLRCMPGYDAGGDLLGFCGGIEVGRLALPARVEPGATVLLPVTRLPLVPLPAAIRLADSVGGTDLAAPWMLSTPAAAAALLGPSAPVVEDLRLDQGLLRGSLLDRVNGLLQPLLFARVNEASSRMVAVEAPAALPEGGSSWRFALPLGPADLNGNGLSVVLHLVGLETPLARFDWLRAGAEEPATRLAGLEARIGQLEQAGTAVQALLEAEMHRRLAIQQERIDAFVEAAATLLLDRLAPEAAAPALRGLVAMAADAVPAPLADRAEVMPASPHFGFGWHTPEQDGAGEFRWMAGLGLLGNPAPHRPVAAVTLAIRHVYGAPEPVLRAGFDGLACEVAVRAEGPGCFAARITPPAPDEALPCLVLRLDSPHAGSPARDGASGDDRVLSVAVAKATFDYAD